ncbi:MAG: cobaltochelatase subunit CobN [Pseudomonadota bacterium]
MPRRLPTLALASALVATALPASAATLFGVVSPRAADDAARAAEQFLDEHPEHELVLRSREQVATMEAGELDELVSEADALFAGGTFDTAARRLRERVARLPADRPFIAFHSEPALVRASRLAGEQPMADLDDDQRMAVQADAEVGEDPVAHYQEQLEAHPDQADWLTARTYWAGRGPDNLAGLYAWLARQAGAGIEAPEPRPPQPLTWRRGGEPVAPGELEVDEDEPVVAVLDYDTGARAGAGRVQQAVCDAVEAAGNGSGPACVVVRAAWGEPTASALEGLAEGVEPGRLAGVVTLQDFVLGGSDAADRATAALEDLDVPVLKGLRLAETDGTTWRLGEAGVPVDTVSYRLAMPERQGVSQPLVLATAGPEREQEATGLELAPLRPQAERITRAAERLRRWVALQEKDNAEKRIALIYYNHPPGRHNVGADNLDVPASLLQILRQLREAGYNTGDLPEDEEALMERIQREAVNLPEDRTAVAEMAERTATLDGSDYAEWFETLPAAARAEMVHGPLGRLAEELKTAADAGATEAARGRLERTLGDLEHLLAGSDHAEAASARQHLQSLRSAWEAALEGEEDAWERAEEHRQSLEESGIEGLEGWGAPPGEVMVHDGEQVLPGIRFGNVFVGPQPPRGWETDEEMLHANTTIAPPHQYLGFYHWLRDDFGADALIHLGRHSTYEFLPGPRAGMDAADFPDLVAGDLPGIYPYIVDGVGEGLQAKRRGLAVTLSHLTPPLEATELYDELLELRELVESWESGAGQDDTPLREEAVATLRERLRELDLAETIAAEIAAEKGVDSLDFEEVDDAQLVHEAGHYLTHLQEEFLPHGLHVFGRDWSEESIETMLESMEPEEDQRAEVRADLAASPAAEREALLAGLDGRFVAPGKGNDPVRTPEVLPTGRNFHALDGDLLPTRLAWRLGRKLAADAADQDGSEGRGATVLWASDTVRDQGAMIAFGLAGMGVKPVWSARGNVEGVKRLPLEEVEERRDMVFTTSGLFRDLYGDLLDLLDRAGRRALAGSAETIRTDHPELAPALAAALEPLGEDVDPGDEPLAANGVARQWVEAARAGLGRGAEAEAAGRQAALRVFGDAPGSYGAGVNRLAERSGAWQARGEVADTYLHRMGHAYGAGDNGDGRPAQDALRQRLEGVEAAYLGRASNLYGLMDNDDAFDYLGGLSLAVESITGEAPSSRVIQHADPEDPRMESLDTALVRELQGRYLNPQWLEPLTEHGYAGARTLGSEFVEHLWGWQVTNPGIVRDWMWDEVHETYLEDKRDLGLDEFLAESGNRPVRAHIQAVLLVAVDKGYWSPDEEVVEDLARSFAEYVAEEGLPGSGHTTPDHPMLDRVRKHLDDPARNDFDAAVARAEAARARAVKVERPAPEKDAERPEARPAQGENADQSTPEEAPQEERRQEEADRAGETDTEGLTPSPWWLAPLGLLALAGGVRAWRRTVI